MEKLEQLNKLDNQIQWEGSFDLEVGKSKKTMTIAVSISSEGIDRESISKIIEATRKAYNSLYEDLEMERDLEKVAELLRKG